VKATLIVNEGRAELLNMSALEKAIDNLNAALGVEVRLPIMDGDVLNLATLAERRGRQDIADCLRDALQLEHELNGRRACACEICLEQASLIT
jgi:hypothetical protein